MIDTSEPYTGAMRDTVCEPQANIGANQSSRPVGRKPGRWPKQKLGLKKI